MKGQPDHSVIHDFSIYGNRYGHYYFFTELEYIMEAALYRLVLTGFMVALLTPEPSRLIQIQATGHPYQNKSAIYQELR